MIAALRRLLGQNQWFGRIWAANPVAGNPKAIT